MNQAMFQIALPVADLARSIGFYRMLMQGDPVERGPRSARFESAQLPLALTLVVADARPERTMNHLGFRMPDQVALVALQRRLEESGIATQRQEGVECCYALQTKFWVTDPDKHLWELYILHEDIAHSGFDDPKTQHPWQPKAQPKVWLHALTAPLPAHLDFAAGTLDEVRFEGTFNGELSATARASILAEAHRVLRPGGAVAIHGMVSDRPLPAVPSFPGIAALVKQVPTCAELSEQLLDAGFTSLQLDKLDSVCLSVPGVELREIRLRAIRAGQQSEVARYHVMYRGPFAEVADDAGHVFSRGERVEVGGDIYRGLREGVEADQFVFFPAKNESPQESLI